MLAYKPAILRPMLSRAAKARKRHRPAVGSEPAVGCAAATVAPPCARAAVQRRALDPMHATGSRNRLTHHQLGLYPGDTLFERLARVVCLAGFLPRKELHEAWEVAKRVHRRYRGGRVVDLACGHGLLAQAVLLLDETATGALAVDKRLSGNHRRLADALAQTWPRLHQRVEFVEARLEDTVILPGDLVVSAHACGGLTDAILAKAIAARARVAVLPCCQALRRHGDLDGWLEGTLAIDVERAVRLREAGYVIHTQSIPAEVSPKNRLLMGAPARQADLEHAELELAAQS